MTVVLVSREFTNAGDVRHRVLYLLLLTLPGCQQRHESSFTEPAVVPQHDNISESAALPFFQERTDITGLRDFHRSNPHSFEMPGIMGSGCALADLDGNGLLDLILVPGDISHSGNDGESANCRVLIQESPWQFRDVSDQAGLAVRGFGMGCFAADIDNDGDMDLLLTSASGATLYRNDGNLSFTDITQSSGLKSGRWCTAAVFYDYDRDGWLDIFIVNYVDYFPGSVCQDAAGRRDYCGPQAFSGTSDQLFRNLGGDGTPGVFSEETVAVGLAGHEGKGLGAIISDLNGDGLADIYVANDMEPNFLWIQGADGRFHEEANLRGCAVDLQGRPQASMGTALFDVNQDGLADIFLTHLRGETNTLYRQLSPGAFLDATSTSGLGEPSRNQTGFGVVARDLDLDGAPELVIVNGRVMRSPLHQNRDNVSHWDDYAESNQIMNGVRGRDEQFTEYRGSDPFVIPVEVSRGLAAGDIDNDGDIDLLVTNVSGPARLYENIAARQGNWLLVTVFDPDWQRDATGAQVTLIMGDRRIVAEVMPQSGYLSHHDVRLHFGTGAAVNYDAIEVRWPDKLSLVETFGPGDASQRVTLIRGSGVLQSSAMEETARP